MPEKLQTSGVTAIVLAAGTSSRMGSPKQLLRAGGETLLERTLGILRRSKVDEIVVVLGHEAAAIQEQVELVGVKIVVNKAYREGMGTSLREGASNVASSARAALVVLADQPLLQPMTIDRLIDEYQEHKPQIVLPLYRGFRGNPVLLDRSVFPEIMGLSGDVGCRAIFGSHTENILKVSVEDVGVLLDVDTKVDLEKFRRASVLPETLPALLETVDLGGLNFGGAEVPAARPQLVIVGQEAVGKALVKLGGVLKFSVTVVDPFLTLEELPGADCVLHTLDFSRLQAASETFALVASRGRFDEEAIEQALNAGVSYVALVANKKRVAEVIRSLQARGISQEQLARLHAPAGIYIGADGPEEIALSVLAEIVSERRRREAPADRATAD
jgi:molybdenum cofactor cytidylyltransferase